jgi:myo-inositol-1(or 4)-monophosphatase
VSDFLDAAERIVRQAGSLAKEMAVTSTIRAHKPAGDLVTNGDLAVEELVLSFLKKEYPDHGFYSEERGREHDDAEFVWILDPIDGTKYYARHNPLYAISLALTRNRESIVGVVFSPELEQMFCAAKGEGATLNGQRVTCSKESDLSRAVLCVEIPSRHSSPESRALALRRVDLLIQHAERVRILGVSSLGLAFCANGGFDAYVNLGSASALYDIAAGRLILEEAGGQFSTASGCMIAGPTALCAGIQEILASSTPQTF